MSAERIQEKEQKYRGNRRIADEQTKSRRSQENGIVVKCRKNDKWEIRK